MFIILLVLLAVAGWNTVANWNASPQLVSDVQLPTLGEESCNG